MLEQIRLEYGCRMPIRNVINITDSFGKPQPTFQNLLCFGCIKMLLMDIFPFTMILFLVQRLQPPRSAEEYHLFELGLILCPPRPQSALGQFRIRCRIFYCIT